MNGHARAVGAVLVALAAIVALGVGAGQLIVWRSEFEEFRASQAAYQVRVEKRLERIEDMLDRLLEERRPPARSR